MYLDKGTLVVMGDFNAHINGQLFIKCHDRRSHIFNQFLSENKLSIANTLDLCTGTPSTFVSYCGQYTSMIDHILVQNEKVDLVSVCKILDDDALNVSTHRPIVMHLNLPHAEQFLSDVPCRRRVKWCKVNQEEIIKYRERLNTLCLNRPQNVLSPTVENDIDSLYNDISRMVKSASDDHLPSSKKFNKHLKPYWDQSLKDLHKAMREKRKMWISDGRPRGILFSSYRQYKESKRIFRQYHRHCSEKYLKSLNEEIDNAAGLDSRYFWKLVNTRRKNSTSNVGAELRFNGQIFRDSQKICDQWGHYFNNLYSHSGNENFDPTNFNYVTERVAELKHQTITSADIVLVTLQELDDTVCQLSKGMA